MVNLAVMSLPIQALRGVPFITTVATFPDPNAAPYTALVDWGDTQKSSGTGAGRDLLRGQRVELQYRRPAHLSVGRRLASRAGRKPGEFESEVPLWARSVAAGCPGALHRTTRTHGHRHKEPAAPACIQKTGLDLLRVLTDTVRLPIEY
jgi:hypothetical protein